MNQEELKYHKALQGVYARHMGPWMFGDIGYFFKSGKSGHYYGKFLEDGKVVEIFILGDDVLSSRHETPIRTPLTIDPVNPERGCIGMLIGRWRLHYLPLGDYMLEHGDQFAAETPTLVILKALAAQEGVEVC